MSVFTKAAVSSQVSQVIIVKFSVYCIGYVMGLSGIPHIMPITVQSSPLNLLLNGENV